MINSRKSSIEAIPERIIFVLENRMIDMVQQTKDSKFCEYGLANTETGSPNTAKQLSAPLSAKKTVLRDLQNENGKLVPKPSAQISDESRPTSESVKISNPKRSTTESLKAPLPQLFPMSNAVNGHLVYVRRKPDTELGRSNACHNRSDGVDCSQLRETDSRDESTQNKSQVKEPKICSPEISSIPMSSSVSFSSAMQTDSTSNGKSSHILPQENLNCPHGSPDPGSPDKVNGKHWEERYIQLQNLLKKLDQSDQNDYIHMLQSLPSVELSRYAVELEKRAIYLSLKEVNIAGLSNHAEVGLLPWGKLESYKELESWMYWRDAQSTQEFLDPTRPFPEVSSSCANALSRTG